MAALALAARPRTTLGKAVKRLRRAGITPANIYGHNTASLAIEAEEHALTTLLRRAGRTALVEITVEGEAAPRNVLVRSLTRRATTDQLLHVDFFQVSMREKLSVDVPVVLVGEAPAVALHDAVVVQSLESLSVECLPGDIPSHIDADISGLMDANSTLFVRDLSAPAGVTILNDPDIAVVSVSAQSVEEEEPTTEEEAAAEAAASTDSEVSDDSA